jgi:site-specific DNA recombinase
MSSNAGRIVWNKVRMLKALDTGKRLSRPNTREEWQSIDVPELRIVEQCPFGSRCTL